MKTRVQDRGDSVVSHKRYVAFARVSTRIYEGYGPTQEEALAHLDRVIQEYES